MKKVMRIQTHIRDTIPAGGRFTVASVSESFSERDAPSRMEITTAIVRMSDVIVLHQGTRRTNPTVYQRVEA